MPDNDDGVRACPNCHMPAYIGNDGTKHGPWFEHFGDEELACNDCGWDGTWDDVETVNV